MPEQHFYQAIGTVEGILDLTDAQPTLTIGEIAFPLKVPSLVQRQHQPGQVQGFLVYPKTKKGQPFFEAIAVVNNPPTPLRLKGCWEEYQNQAYLVVYRNQLPTARIRQLHHLVEVVWENAPPADGQFWELEAEIENGAFVVKKASGPFEPPPKADPHAEAPPLTDQEMQAMSVPVQIQLTCKINQVPPHRQLPNQLIEFFLNAGRDRILTVRMKPKQFRKLTDHGYDRWVATISGELGGATKNGFELLNPVVQVFEKKAKTGDLAN